VWYRLPSYVEAIADVDEEQDGGVVEVSMKVSVAAVGAVGRGRWRLGVLGIPHMTCLRAAVLYR
jgi:hypothetical protein